MVDADNPAELVRLLREEAKLFKMSVLVYVPIKDGKAIKAGLEAASYAVALDANAVAVSAGELSGDAGLGMLELQRFFLSLRH